MRRTRCQSGLGGRHGRCACPFHHSHVLHETHDHGCRCHDAHAAHGCGSSDDPDAGHHRAVRHGCSTSQLHNTQPTSAHSHSQWTPRPARVRRTLVSSCQDLMSASAPACRRPRGVAWWTFGAGVALAGTLDRLVDGLGRRLRLPVRVELRVIAFITCQCLAVRMLRHEVGGGWEQWRVAVPRSSYWFCREEGCQLCGRMTG